MSFSKWSLKKIEFVLSHIEDFVEDESPALKKALAEFEIQTGLEHLSMLHVPAASDPELPAKIFERIAPFYEAGLLLRNSGTDEWRITEFFWRGQVFSLETEDQLPAGKVMREISPLQVNSAPASRVLEELGCGFLKVPADSRGFLFRPAEGIAYVLVSNLPELWSADHVQSTMTLLNRSFSL